MNLLSSILKLMKFVLKSTLQLNVLLKQRTTKQTGNFNTFL
jgi:hypothetical protein